MYVSAVLPNWWNPDTITSMCYVAKWVKLVYENMYVLCCQIGENMLLNCKYVVHIILYVRGSDFLTIFPRSLQNCWDHSGSKKTLIFPQQKFCQWSSFLDMGPISQYKLCFIYKWKLVKKPFSLIELVPKKFRNYFIGNFFAEIFSPETIDKKFSWKSYFSTKLHDGDVRIRSKVFKVETFWGWHIFSVANKVAQWLKQGNQC